MNPAQMAQMHHYPARKRISISHKKKNQSACSIYKKTHTNTFVVHEKQLLYSCDCLQDILNRSTPNLLAEMISMLFAPA